MTQQDLEMIVEATAIHITMGDLEKNYQTMLRKIRESAERGVDVVVLPESATHGYAVGDELEMTRFLENNKRVVEKLMEETRDLDIAVAVGYTDFDPKKTGHDGRMIRYNNAVVFQKGEVKGTVTKNLLPNYTLFDEQRWFAPGKLADPIEIDVHGKKVKLGVGICEMKWADDYVKMVEQEFREFKQEKRKEFSTLVDSAFEEKAKELFNYETKIEFANPALHYARQGADALVWINASPFQAGKNHKIDSLNRKRVAETGLPFVDVNFVGIGDNSYDLFGFSGESSVWDNEGNLISVTRPWQEESAIVRLNLTTGKGERITGEPSRHLYATLQDFINARRGKKSVSVHYDESTDGFVRQYVDEALFGLVYLAGEFVRQSGHFEGVAESLSGGIDSAVGTSVAVMAQQLGFYGRVEAKTFPTQFTSATTLGLAHAIVDNLGIKLVEESIQEEFVYKVRTHLQREAARGEVDQQAFAEAEQRFAETGNVEDFYHLFKSQLTLENIQARLRSERMKLWTSEESLLEFVNPNKDERREGYTSLWGDMAGAYMVIGDCPKWLVRAMAQRINELHEREIIPEQLIHKVKPSAELSSAQNPERGGGDPFDYAALSIVLDSYTYARKDVPEIVAAYKTKTLDLHGCPQVDAQGIDFFEKFTVEQFKDEVTARLRQNEIMRYKGVVAPLAGKVTRRALGFELRTPVTSHYFRSAERREAVGLY